MYTDSFTTGAPLDLMHFDELVVRNASNFASNSGISSDSNATVRSTAQSRHRRRAINSIVPLSCKSSNACCHSAIHNTVSNANNPCGSDTQEDVPMSHDMNTMGMEELTGLEGLGLSTNLMGDLPEDESKAVAELQSSLQKELLGAPAQGAATAVSALTTTTTTAVAIPVAATVTPGGMAPSSAI